MRLLNWQGIYNRGAQGNGEHGYPCIGRQRPGNAAVYRPESLAPGASAQRTGSQDGRGVAPGGGQRWGRVTVNKVLTNEANCGTLVFGGRPGHSALSSGLAPVRVADAWPGIVSREPFQLVLEKMGGRRPAMVHPRTVPGNYLLSGMLFCYCGRAMTGHKAKSGRNFYYICQRKYKQRSDACSARMVPQKKLEKAVVAQLRREVLTENNIEELGCLVNEELRSSSGLLHQKVQLIDAEMHDARARLGKLHDAIETGKLELDDLAPRIRELKRSR